MRLTYFMPYEGKIETLKLKGRISIGLKEDVEGNLWDIYDYIGGDYTESGKPIVHARLKDSSPKYSTANWDSNKGWHIQFIPFHVEFIN